MLRTITKKEWIIVGAASALFMVLANIPFVYGFFHTPPDRVYLGLHYQTPGDFPVYYSYINQVASGNFFARDLFTAEQQNSGAFNWFWVILGLVSKTFNLSAVVVFHLARLIFIPLVIIVNYVIIAWFLASLQHRLTAFALTFGAGAGIFFAFANTQTAPSSGGFGYLLPVDLWVAHGFTFSILQQSPHSMLSWIFQLLILLFAFFALTHDKVFSSVLAGILSMLLFNFHPYVVPLLFAIIALYALYLAAADKLLLSRAVIHLAFIFGLSIFALAYFFILLKSDFTFAARSAQNITRLPSLPHVFLGYAYLLIFSAIGIYVIFKKKIFHDKTVFVFLWLCVTIVFILIPSQIQTRFLQAFVIPLSILSSLPFVMLFGYVKSAHAKYFLGIFLGVLFSLSLTFNMAVNLSIIKNNPAMFSLSVETVEALKWMRKNTKPEAVILSTPDDGLFIGAFAVRKAYVGHGHETLVSEHKQEQALQFFASQSEVFKKAFLKQNAIDYIYARKGQFEAPDFIKTVFQNKQVVIYKVQ